MPNPDRSVWIVFNGEIYNFREIRKLLEAEGFAFRSECDTEVVLRAYERWGDDHVHKLRGMFAYAIVDLRGGERRVLLVRDRVGIKPLFYSWEKGRLHFASEIKSILATGDVDKRWDRTALFDYLTYLYVPAPKTAYAAIRKLPPGHLLVWERGEVSIRQYWDAPVAEAPLTMGAREADEAFATVLDEAVRLHLVSDVPVGIFLSGGLDSSTVTALAARSTNDPFETFSIGFDSPEHDEREYARLVSQRYKTRHAERLLGFDSAEAALTMMARLYDEPFADGSAVPTFQVSELAREHVKVVLSGDGGDEVFAGYKWHRAYLKRQRAAVVPAWARGAIAAAAKAMPFPFKGKRFASNLGREPVAQYGELVEMFSPERKRSIVSPELAREFRDYDDYWYFRKFWRKELDPVTRVQYLDLKTYLPDDILTKVDRASMAVSLEVRPPLLDHVLIETVFRIPVALRAGALGEKRLLRRVAEPLVPAPILARPKRGFSAPWNSWIRAHAARTERSLLALDGGFLRLDSARIQPMIARGAEAWSLLVLGEWMKA